jgi:hypothetical protein
MNYIEKRMRGLEQVSTYIQDVLLVLIDGYRMRKLVPSGLLLVRLVVVSDLELRPVVSIQ